MVDVIVTDRKGRSVSGLAAEDFSVYDNNVQQRIVTFVPPLASRPVPVSQAEASGPKPASAREALDLAKAHFITLVLDLGDLQPQNIRKACDAAAEYLRNTLAPEDLVAVYWVDQGLHIALPFTPDKQKAVDTIEEVGRKRPGGRLTVGMRMSTEQDIQKLEGEWYGFGASSGPGAGQTSSLGPGKAAMIKRELDTLRRFLWTQSTLQARAVYVALRAIAQSYQDLPGRKNVVVFSEGFIRSPEAQPAMQAVIDAANRANVAFYVVDAGGLTANINARLAVPELKPLRVRAVLQFSNGTVALGEEEISIPRVASGPKLTSLLLSDHIEPAQGSADASDPLRGENFQLHVPAQPHFSANDQLTVYFGILNASLDAAKGRPRLRVSYAVKSGETVAMSPPTEEIRSGETQDRILVLKQFNLKGLRAGTYTLDVTVEDLTRGATASQSASFVIG